MCQWSHQILNYDQVAPKPYKTNKLNSKAYHKSGTTVLDHMLKKLNNHMQIQLYTSTFAQWLWYYLHSSKEGLRVSKKQFYFNIQKKKTILFQKPKEKEGLKRSTRLQAPQN